MLITDPLLRHDENVYKNQKRFIGKIKLSQKVELQCDNCAEIFFTGYTSYIKYNEKFCKDLCSSCKKSEIGMTWIGDKNPFYGKTHTDENKQRISEMMVKLHEDGGVYNDEWLKKMSVANTGEKNSFYGKSHTIDTINALKEMNIGKFSGKNNPMYGKPSPEGSGRGIKGWYKDNFFRSLLELSYMIHLDENDVKFVSAETKNYRVKYDYGRRTYHPDFLLIESGEIIEVKPHRLKTLDINKKKFNAAKKKYGSKFKILTERDFKKVKKCDILDLERIGIVKFCKNDKDRFLKQR